MINISELIEDPDFCQPDGITIKRRTTMIVNHRPVNDESTIKVAGIITIADENSDDLLEQADRNTEAINVFTYDRLKTVGSDKLDEESYSADIVVYNGCEYIVRKCMDDAQYGFCRSYAVKMEVDEM